MGKEQDGDQVRGEVRGSSKAIGPGPTMDCSQETGGGAAPPLEKWREKALEPISQGLLTSAGFVAADAGRGLALRLDNGTQYLSDHFQNQLRHGGMHPGFAFIEQPQTNGVAERFIRTLKEQIIYGRVFQKLQEVRTAVRRFVDPYNREWLVEKKRLQKPLAGQGSMARPSLTRQGRLKITCVQNTGCGTAKFSAASFRLPLLVLA